MYIRIYVVGFTWGSGVLGAIADMKNSIQDIVVDTWIGHGALLNTDALFSNRAEYVMKSTLILARTYLHLTAFELKG